MYNWLCVYPPCFFQCVFFHRSDSNCRCFDLYCLKSGFSRMSIALNHHPSPKSSGNVTLTQPQQRTRTSCVCDDDITLFTFSTRLFFVEREKDKRNRFFSLISLIYKVYKFFYKLCCECRKKRERKKTATQWIWRQSKLGIDILPVVKIKNVCLFYILPESVWCMCIYVYYYFTLFFVLRFFCFVVAAVFTTRPVRT